MLGRLAKPDPDDTDRVRRWVREAFGFPDEGAVMVTEVRCAESDCPDVETVVAVLLGPAGNRTYKFPTPVAAVGRAEVALLADTGTYYR